MYVHVPAAWLAFLSFGVVFLASVAYLKTGRIRLGPGRGVVGRDRRDLLRADDRARLAVGAPGLGHLVDLGPAADDDRVLLLIYVGYLSLRRVADSPTRRARWSAVVGVVGFVDVPIVHMSVVWWRSLHQQATVLRPGAPTIAGSMLATLLLGVPWSSRSRTAT